MQFTSKIKFLLCMTAIFSFNQAFAETIYLQAKQYLDVQTGQLIKPANLLIENGVIKAINPLHAPESARVVKKPELTLLPGLMDMHVHLPMDFNPQFALQYVQDDAATATIRGVKNANTLLMAGFTTVRNLGQIYPGESFVDVALAKASEAGWIQAPHIVPAGHAISMTGGHLDPDMMGAYAPQVLSVSYRTGVADGVDEVVKAVRYQIKHGAKVIKVAATAGVLSEEEGAGTQQYSYKELKAIVDEANLHQISVAAHAHGTAGINAAIKAGVRSIEHGSLLDEESIRLMKQNNTFLVPTPFVKDSINLALYNENIQKKAAYLFPLAKQNLKKAIEGGVKIAFGTDSGVIPHGDNAREFSSLVDAGMSPLNVIQTATLNAAELLKLQDRGNLRLGFHADIIGVNENPLLNIRTLEQVSFVMKDGKIVKG